jgi:hypothetical protein
MPESVPPMNGQAPSRRPTIVIVIVAAVVMALAGVLFTAVFAPGWARSSEVTVNVAGQEYTCGQLIDAENQVCSLDFQDAFDRWGDRVDAYVNSGRLGPLGNEMRFEDAAASGLAACIVAERGGPEQAYIDFLRQFYPEESGVAFRPRWVGADRDLCPDVDFR